MNAAIILLSLLGSPKYATREWASNAVEQTFPLSLPVVVIGLQSRDAETRQRCQRAAMVGERKLLEWAVLYVVWGYQTEGGLFISNYEMKWLERITNGQRRVIESIVAQRFGIGGGCMGDYSGLGCYYVRGYFNIIRHFVRGQDCRGGWRRADYQIKPFGSVQ